MKPATLLIDLHEMSECCTDHALEFLHKAQSQPPDADIWAKHPLPLLAGPIETFTDRGLAALVGLRRAVEGLLKQLFATRKARMLTRADVEKAIEQLRDKSIQEWTADDWMSVVDWLALQYLPNEFIRDASEYLTVRSIVADRIRQTMRDAVPGRDELIPDTLARLRKLGLVNQTQELLATIAMTQAAEAITQIGEHTKHRIKTIVLNHLQQRAGGNQGTWKNLEQDLRDEFAILNRDWRRVAITEAGSIANEVTIAGCKPGTKVRRVEAYQGACPFCASINGRIFTVVDAADPERDGARDVWVGKNNVGRSASPRKRMGDELVPREAEEMWWPAAGLQHPNCRGHWEVIANQKRDPKAQQFVDDLLAKHGLAKS